MAMPNDEIYSPKRTRSRPPFGGAQAHGKVIDQDGREIPETVLHPRSGGFRFEFGTSSANPFGNLTREQRMARLDALARLLDVAFILPGTNIRYGIDGIIGLIPVIGDPLTPPLPLGAGARGAGARRALACPGTDARQCRGGWRGRNGAARRRRLRRDVPRQYAQH